MVFGGMYVVQNGPMIVSIIMLMRISVGVLPQISNYCVECWPCLRWKLWISVISERRQLISRMISSSPVRS